jgi:hypothetical protein
LRSDFSVSSQRLCQRNVFISRSWLNCVLNFRNSLQKKSGKSNLHHWWVWVFLERVTYKNLHFWKSSKECLTVMCCRSESTNHKM